MRHLVKLRQAGRGMTIGRGNPEWGAPEKEVFIIKLGERC